MSNSTTPSQVLTALESHGYKITPTNKGWKSICRRIPASRNPSVSTTALTALCSFTVFRAASIRTCCGR